jgi:phosphoglycolate phosphatase
VKIRNIIFDWSGTLVDDLPAVWRSTNTVFQRAGVPEMSLERFRAEFELPFDRFYRRHLPERVQPQLEEWFHDAFRNNQDSVEALPHAREFLRFCRDRHVRTFLLSSVIEEHYEKQAAKTGFAGFIDHPYLGVRDKRRRIADILKEHRLNAEETLFIGDMEHDVETAHCGGIRSCAVLTGYNKVHQLRAAEPDVLVEHLGDLREMLQSEGMRLSRRSLKGAPVERPVLTVGAAIFNDAGRVLLVRSVKWADKWGIPGGKVRRGESVEAALVREVKEETNLDVTRPLLVHVQDVIEPEEYHWSAHFVLLNYCCVASGLQDVVINHEASCWKWVTPAEALSEDLNGPSRRLLVELADQRP